MSRFRLQRPHCYSDYRYPAQTGLPCRNARIQKQRVCKHGPAKIPDPLLRQNEREIKKRNLQSTAKDRASCMSLSLFFTSRTLVVLGPPPSPLPFSLISHTHAGPLWSKRYMKKALTDRISCLPSISSLMARKHKHKLPSPQEANSVMKAIRPSLLIHDQFLQPHLMTAPCSQTQSYPNGLRRS